MEYIFTIITVSIIYKASVALHREGLSAGKMLGLFTVREDNREFKNNRIPLVGGICIFLSLILSNAFMIYTDMMDTQTLLAFFTSGILLIVGIVDDKYLVSAKVKLGFQVITAWLLLFVVHTPTISMTDSSLANTVLTILIIIYIINSINLIDGVDMLAGSICLVISIYMATYFLVSGLHTLGLFSLSISISMTAFLAFNRFPARMYLGDSGTLFLGSLLVFLALHFQEAVLGDMKNVFWRPLFIFNIFFIPAIDTARVIFIRLFNHKNPLSPDKNHIHHRLMSYGLNPIQITILLASIQTIALLTSYLFPGNIIIVSITAILTFLVVDSKSLWKLASK